MKVDDLPIHCPGLHADAFVPSHVVRNVGEAEHELVLCQGQYPVSKDPLVGPFGVCHLPPPS